MALGESFTGTEAALGTTEWSMTRDASFDNSTWQSGDGVYVAHLDLNDMVQGDVVRIRIYERARSGDTSRILYEYLLAHAQATPNFETDPWFGLHGWEATVTALVGTVAVNWDIRAVT